MIFVIAVLVYCIAVCVCVRVCVWGEAFSFIVAVSASVFSCCFVFGQRKIFLYVYIDIPLFVVFQSKKNVFSICIH